MIMIIPRVKKEKYLNGDIKLRGTIGVWTDGEDAEKALEILRVFMPELCFEKSEDALIVFRRCTLQKKGAYTLNITDKAEICYDGFDGAKNSVATLVQLTKKSGEEYSLKNCEIEDYPDFKLRSFMIDLARGIGEKETIRETVIRMSRLKYNRVHFHLSDEEGFAWQSKKCDKLTGPFGDQHSMEYLKSLHDLCVTLGLEVVPEVEIPAHARTLINCYPELSCLTDHPESQTNWAVCSNNEKVYEIYSSLVGEVVEMFPSCKYIHIGGDEVDCKDLWGLTCEWQNCKKCAELGFNNNQEIYYYVIKRAYNIVKSYGKEVSMWNDWIDISKPCPLPKDILIEFWQVAEPNRGPVEGCSLEKFLEQGYSVVNAYYKDVYFISSGKDATAESLKTWHPAKRPEIAEKCKDKIIGGEGCAWNFGNVKQRFYRYTLPSSLALLADRLWNEKEFEYNSELSCAVTRAVLGVDTPKNFDVFKYIGTVFFLSDNEALGCSENVTATKEELEQAILTLVPIMTADTYGKKAALAYAECIEWMKNKLYK